jgi:internalin A
MPPKSHTYLASSDGMKRLDAAKASLGLSFADIATRSGVSVGTVRRLWQGKRVEEDNLSLIADALGIPPEEIVGADEWGAEGRDEAQRRIQKAFLTGATVLDLSGIRLAEVPLELSQLTRLESLDLSNNKLTSVPPELGQLANLTQLALHQNQLTSVPPELG